ncbi:MAG TPA: NifB/NifX family molybdenum-iron cluster-binding protein, partial [Syntrophomonas sp.]|nr:NifB/NifX family molybdenum-iron cluster-binding protein [Syntrophomonas sp.]
ANTEQGQGTIGAKALVQAGVKAVIVSRIGLKAFLILQRAGIDVFTGANGKSITEAVQMLQHQQLNKADSPNG